MAEIKHVLNTSIGLREIHEEDSIISIMGFVVRRDIVWIKLIGRGILATIIRLLKK